MIALAFHLVALLIAHGAQTQTEIIPETDLLIEEEGEAVFPRAFRGRWAPSISECGEHSFSASVITGRRAFGYEWSGRLLQTSPVIHESTPSREPAHTIVALAAWSGESDELGIGRIRLSRVGDRLYKSNAETVGGQQHWQREFANVRCPDVAPAAR